MEQGREIGAVRKMDGRRNSDDIEIGTGKRLHVRSQGKGRGAEVARLYLLGAVTPSLQLGDSSCVNIEANHRHARAGESDRHWQSNIAESDHRNISSVRHSILPAMVPLWPGGSTVPHVVG